jgi:hypothetical protein
LAERARLDADAPLTIALSAQALRQRYVSATSALT